jgi:hypothetical protein
MKVSSSDTEWGEAGGDLLELRQVLLAHPDHDPGPGGHHAAQVVAEPGELVAAAEARQQLLELVEDQDERLSGVGGLELHLLVDRGQHRADVGRTAGGLTGRRETARVGDHDDRMARLLQGFHECAFEERALAGAAVAGDDGNPEVGPNYLGEQLGRIPAPLRSGELLTPAEAPETSECARCRGFGHRRNLDPRGLHLPALGFAAI